MSSSLVASSSFIPFPPYHADTNIRHENLIKIATALEVSVEDLLEQENNDDTKNNNSKTEVTPLFISKSADAMFKKRVEEILNESIESTLHEKFHDYLMEKLAEIDPIFKSEQLNETTLGLYATSSARDILEPYSKLNEAGKEKAVELVSDLAKKKYYQRDPDTKK